MGAHSAENAEVRAFDALVLRCEDGDVVVVRPADPADAEHVAADLALAFQHARKKVVVCVDRFGCEITVLRAGERP